MTKTFSAANKVYRTKELADLHTEWSKDKIIYEFELPTAGKMKRRNKFGALKASVNGITFQSVMEAKYYVYLLHKQDEGIIKNIQLQVPFELIPRYRDTDGSIVRSVTYIADFCFETVIDGEKHIIDVKGTETPEFKIKWKILGWKYPDYVRQIIQWYNPTREWLTLKDIRKLKRGGGYLSANPKK